VDGWGGGEKGKEGWGGGKKTGGVESWKEEGGEQRRKWQKR